LACGEKLPFEVITKVSIEVQFSTRHSGILISRYEEGSYNNLKSINNDSWFFLPVDIYVCISPFNGGEGGVIRVILPIGGTTTWSLNCGFYQAPPRRDTH
jgi:hypothetical protein